MTATKLIHSLLLMLVAGVMCIGVALGLDRETRVPAVVPAENKVYLPILQGEKKETVEKDDALPAGAVTRLGTVRFRHAGDVTTIAHFPDGKTVASGGLDGMIRFWDAATGKELRRVPGNHLTLAPDGKSWASWSSWGKDDKIRLWDLATGKQLREFTRRGRIHVVAFSPDGKVLAAGGVNAEKLNQLSFWDAGTGQELPAPQMGGKYDYVHHLAFSPDGKLLATAGETNGSVNLWDLATGKEIKRFRALKSGGTQVLSPFAFSPDSQTLVSAGKWSDSGQVEPGIYLWDLATGKELRQFKSPRIGACSAIMFSPGGESLVSGHDGVACLWVAATGKLLHSLHGHEGAVTSLSLSADGKSLATGSRDHTLRLWDLASGKPLHPSPGHHGTISSVALSADGKTVISAGWDRTIRLWDVASGKETRRLVDPAPVRALALAPGGRVLASRSQGMSDQEARICLWDLVTGKELHQLPEKYGTPALALSPDGRALAAGSFRAIIVLDPATGKELTRAVFPGGQHFGDIPFIAFAPDGKTFAWVTYSTCRVSETATGKELQRFTFPRGPDSLASISWGAFSPDGKTLLLRTDGAFCLWDIAERKEVRRFAVDVLQAFSAALSPSGKTLATGGADGIIRLWDVATGKARHEFQGHQGNVSYSSTSPGIGALAWSADGKLLVSGGADTTVVVWNVPMP